ncbi:MAG: hypothetical protein ACI4UJ_03455 [Candidatus Cryptobacteroides sp.]
MIHRKAVLALAILTAVMSSCLNPDYDLTKEIDTTMRIEGDVSVPIGNTEAILIGDFLHLPSFSFTPDANFHFSDHYDVSGWNETFNSEDASFDFDRLTLTLDFINYIPLRFVLTAVAIDVEGKQLQDIGVELNADIKGGTLNNPYSTPVEVVINGGGDITRLDGIRLLIEVYAPGSDLLGTPIEPNQCVRAENIKARLQGKVDIEL